MVREVWQTMGCHKCLKNLTTCSCFRLSVLPTASPVSSQAFFTSMDTDGDAQFDINEFTEAVSKVYHVDMFTESTLRSQCLIFHLKCM